MPSSNLRLSMIGERGWAGVHPVLMFGMDDTLMIVSGPISACPRGKWSK